MTLRPASIFFEFQLPNAATWFYFSFLLAVALFFKFSRLLTVRNWDVVSLFLLVPGLLLLQEANAKNQQSSHQGNGGRIAPPPANAKLPRTDPLRSLGYIWLVAGSGYFLFRCLLDLALIGRPALSPNLTSGGLIWFGGALFLGLVYLAILPPEEIVGKKTIITGEMPSQMETAAETVAGQEARWVGISLAIASHLAVIAGMIVIGRWHFQDTEAGISAATLYLLLPYTALFVGQFHHVLPTALLIWAVVCYRRPTLAGLFLGFAAGSQFFPALLFGVWCSFYWRRGSSRFAAAFGLAFIFSLALAGTILLVRGDFAESVRSVLTLADWQAWKAPTTESFWTGVHWAYRLPVFIGYVALLAITAFWPAPKNLAQVLSLSAAALLGIQFWYADQGGVYVLWYLPLLLLLVFRPNLSDRLPSAGVDENDWFGKTSRWVRRTAARMRKQPEPIAKAP